MIKYSNNFMIIWKCKNFQISHIFTNEKEKLTKFDAKEIFFSMVTNFNIKMNANCQTKLQRLIKNNENIAWNQIQIKKCIIPKSYDISHVDELKIIPQLKWQ